MAHINPKTAQRYRERNLTAEELLVVDDHVAGCRFCRHTLLGPRHPDDAVRHVVEGLEDGDSAHLDHDTVASYVDGVATPGERASIEAHIAFCTPCRNDVDDLRAFAREVSHLDAANIQHFEIPRRRKTPAWQWAAAAAVVASLSGAIYFGQRDAANATATPHPSATIALQESHGGLEVAKSGRVHGVSFRDRADEALVSRALTTGTLPTPAALRDLRGSSAVLMGTSKLQSFATVAPLATFVRETRPHFAWTPINSDSKYKVEIYDEAGNEIAKSDWLTTTQWTLDRDLARGRVYQWQVVANDGSIAPAADAPIARFATLDAAAATRVDEAERYYRGSELVLAVLYANAGLMDDARGAAAEARKMNGNSPQVQSIDKQLNELRIR